MQRSAPCCNKADYVATQRIMLQHSGPRCNTAHHCNTARCLQLALAIRLGTEIALSQASERGASPASAADALDAERPDEGYPGPHAGSPVQGQGEGPLLSLVVSTPGRDARADGSEEEAGGVAALHGASEAEAGTAAAAPLPAEAPRLVDAAASPRVSTDSAQTAICEPTPATSAPGLGSPRPHLHRDCAEDSNPEHAADGADTHQSLAPCSSFAQPELAPAEPAATLRVDLDTPVGAGELAAGVLYAGDGQRAAVAETAADADSSPNGKRAGRTDAEAEGPVGVLRVEVHVLTRAHTRTRTHALTEGGRERETIRQSMCVRAPTGNAVKNGMARVRRTAHDIKQVPVACRHAQVVAQNGDDGDDDEWDVPFHVASSSDLDDLDGGGDDGGGAPDRSALALRGNALQCFVLRCSRGIGPLRRNPGLLALRRNAGHGGCASARLIGCVPYRRPQPEEAVNAGRCRLSRAARPRTSALVSAPGCGSRKIRLNPEFGAVPPPHRRPGLGSHPLPLSRRDRPHDRPSRCFARCANKGTDNVNKGTDNVNKAPHRFAAGLAKVHRGRLLHPSCVQRLGG